MDRRGPEGPGEAELPGWIWVGCGRVPVHKAVERGVLALWVSGGRGLGLHASFVTVGCVVCVHCSFLQNDTCGHPKGLP